MRPKDSQAAFRQYALFFECITFVNVAGLYRMAVNEEAYFSVEQLGPPGYTRHVASHDVI